ncbi:MAG: histidine phosphatase family protein [Candidatus Nitrosotenuis sp.]
MNIFLVRHGEVLSNLRKVYAGKSPEPLTERGRRQAYEAGERLKSFNIDALYTSPVKRAVETAMIIGEVTGKEYIVMDEFREMELGPWEGLSEDEIARLYPKEWRIWQEKPAELLMNGRETLNGVLMRALKGMEKVCKDREKGNSIIVTHVAIIRVLLLWRKGETLNHYKTLQIPNCEVFEISV